MKKLLTTTLLLLLSVVGISATPEVYYVATDGSDSNDGTKSAPLKTFGKAYSTFAAGDTIYFRGGTYSITESEIMTLPSTLDVGTYCYTFDLTSKGGKSGALTVIAGYPGERPVFDFSNVKPTCRIVAFRMYVDYIHLKNFEITGVQATCHGHYQSIAIFNEHSSNSIVENVAIHDNKAIGYYATHGHDNLVKNCDAYRNFDDYAAFKDVYIAESGGNYTYNEGTKTYTPVTDGTGTHRLYTADQNYQYYLANGHVTKRGDVSIISETLGGNSDGFGFHACHTTDTNNKFEGCRSWWNADDGYDCINSKAAVEWLNCWAFYNGYEPGGSIKRGDGNGFKAGGYGMSVPCSGFPGTLTAPQAPQNHIHHCVAYYNKANGFYANHHLGGNLWENNTAMYNANNYDMTNRDSTKLATEESSKAEKGTDVGGYKHILKNNVSFSPRTGGQDYNAINEGACTLDNNATATSDKFLDATNPSEMATIELCSARQADGSLPVISFLAAKYGSDLYTNNQGALFEQPKTIFSAIASTTAETYTVTTTGTFPMADYGTYDISNTSMKACIVSTPSSSNGLRLYYKDNKMFCLSANASSLYFIINLQKPIEAGDTIKCMGLMTAAASSNTPLGLKFSASTDFKTSYQTNTDATVAANTQKNLSYIVGENDELVGKTIIYLARYANQTNYFNNLTITRPPITATGCSVKDASKYYGHTSCGTALPSSTFTSAASGLVFGTSPSITLTSTSGGARSSTNKIQDTEVILLSNNTYTISKSANVKSLIMYITTTGAEVEGTIDLDGSRYKDAQGNDIVIPKKGATALEIDMTNHNSFLANIASSGSYAQVVFKVEYNSANLTVADINWASLYLPFDATIPEGMKAYYASGATASTVTLKEITDVIPAKTGVVVNAESGVYTLNAATEAATAISGNLFSGVTADKTFSADEGYVLAGSSAEKTTPVFQMYAKDAVLAAYKAYLPKTAVSNSGGSAKSVINFVFNDDATTINNVDASTSSAQAPATRKAMVNGKFIIIKNGKQYNAAGAQIK